MLFGKDPATVVSIEEARRLLDSLVDRKLSQFASRAERPKAALVGAIKSFEHEIIRFRDTDTAPDLEDMGRVSGTVISGQKVGYTKAILHTLSGFSGEAKAATAYGRIHSMATDADSLLHTVLKTNTTFKLMLQVHARDLQEAKRQFSIMERSIGELKGLLDGASPQFSEYTQIAHALNALSASLSELRAVKSAGAGATAVAAPETKEVNDLEALVSDKRAELDREHAILADKESTIRGALLPLDRAARKYDYICPGKRKLADFVEFPIAEIRGEADYSELADKLLGLRKELESGRIEVKNRDELLAHLDSMGAKDIKGAIKSLEAQSGIVRSLKADLAVLHGRMEQIKALHTDASKMIEDAEQRKRDEERISSQAYAMKSEAEGLFMRFYRKRVEISLG